MDDPVRLVPDYHKTDLELFVGMADSFVDLVVIPMKSPLVLKLSLQSE
jgi:hypothetical protein